MPIEPNPVDYASPKSTATRPPTPNCVIRGCPNPEKTRGLCGTCYACANKAVKNKRVTWEWLVSKGLARAPRKAQTQAKGLFSKQLEGAIAVQPPQPLYVEDSATHGDIGQIDPQAPSIPGPEAAHAASDGPPPPVASDAPPPAKAAPAIVQVDPETGKPYVHPPVPQPQPQPQQTDPYPAPTLPNTNPDGTPRRMTQPEDLLPPQNTPPAPRPPLPWEQ